MWIEPLVAWTLLAGLWWVIAFWLVRGRVTAESRTAGASPPLPQDTPPVTIFKPLVALRSPAPPADLVAALGSFIAQTGDDAEVLFGVETQDAAAWRPVFDVWRRCYPVARFSAVCSERPLTFRNPRGSWLHALAESARAPLWLWSDSDIVAPPGLLATMREEKATTGAGLVTCPYVVNQAPEPAMCLEALYVNVEFYPGVLACREWAKPEFAFGSGMLFAAEEFRRKLRWEELGGRLADDNLVGRRLAPVHISRMTATTLAGETSWKGAVLQYLRRQKTVRWLRPAGYAAQVVIMPVLGWLAAAAWQPHQWWPWAGLALTMTMDSAAGAALCREVGCALRRRAWLVLPFWSLLRALTWLACWLPWPIVYQSQRRIWWSLHRCSEGKHVSPSPAPPSAGRG